MTREEAVAYIEQDRWNATRLGLDRMRALLARLGDPQKGLRFVHVTGSNGKGSTSAMLEAVLRAAGYRTGLYTSPCIQDFSERIRVDGADIPDEALGRLTERLREAADEMADHPSQFEMLTALAFLYFREAACDLVVLEVGMGGALDATNVIDAPEVAVITNVGLEHTEYLGSTLREIALVKSGIIKPGCAAVCYDGAEEVTAVMEEVCAQRNVPLRRVRFADLVPVSCDLDGQRFLWQGRPYGLALLGEYQLHNAATVLEIVAALRERGWAIPEDALIRGLATARWPARMEVASHSPLCIIDGGHNPQCAQALAESFAQLLPGRRAVFLLGVLGDKDLDGILSHIRPLATEYMCLTPLNRRALPAQTLAQALRARGERAAAFEDIPSAIRAALDAAGEEGVVVCFGSLYLVGAVRGVYGKVYRAWLRRRKTAARESLGAAERAERSQRIAERIAASPEYRQAQTILLYRAAGDEVDLGPLEREAKAQGKELAYPLCGRDGAMEARIPEQDGWQRGRFGIEAPDPARSRRVDPDKIDLILCPCVSFDEEGNRLGRGGGYYDRFLPRCSRAQMAAVAFEAQRTERLTPQPWDWPMALVFTETAVYRPRP